MENCQSSNCNHSPIAICLHCQEYLCVEHLLQHNELMMCKANIYCDEFNELTEKIENLSFDKEFISAEEDLNDWLNDQMKSLDKIYEEKLFELKQKHFEVKEKVGNFKKLQQQKISDIRRLFNSKLNKQISLEQLNRMKTTVEQLNLDLNYFQTEECVIKLINNDQINYSYQPNINIQFKKDISSESNKSKLNVDAKPFEYIPKDQNWNSISSIRQKDFNSRLFDSYPLFKAIE